VQNVTILASFVTEIWLVTTKI